MTSVRRKGSICLSGASVHVWEGVADEEGIAPVLRAVVELLRERGFAMSATGTARLPPLEPCLAYDGSTAELRVRAELCGRHLSVLFSSMAAQPKRLLLSHSTSEHVKAMIAVERRRCAMHMAAVVALLVAVGYEARVAQGGRPLPLSVLREMERPDERSHGGPLEALRMGSGWAQRRVVTWSPPD